MANISRQVYFWAHMLDEAFCKDTLDEGGEDIVDNDIYLSNLAKSIGDKAWFLKYIPKDVNTIVDFGGGTGEFAQYC